MIPPQKLTHGTMKVTTMLCISKTFADVSLRIYSLSNNKIHGRNKILTMRAYFHILNEFLQADSYKNATCELHEVSKSTESLQS